MDKILLILCFGLLSSSQGQGQFSSKSIPDDVVRLYNSTNFQNIYDLGTAEWKDRHKPGDIAGWLTWMHGQTGRIISSALVTNTGKSQFIRWNGERKVTGFQIDLDPRGQFDDFRFTAFKEPLSEAELKTVHSDNSLKTPLDFAVNDVVSKFMVYHRPPGLSIGVVKNGKSLTYNYGTVEKGRRELPTATSFYEIGSLIKPFTGILLAQAVLEHKVSLQDDVSHYLSGDYSNLQYQGHPLRLVHLASYTSALPPYQILRPFDESSAKTAAVFFKTYSIASFLDDVKGVRLEAQPGSQYSYSTAGFNLLAYILSRVYQKPFPELIREQLTGPLGMHDTKLDLSPEERTRFPKGYEAAGVEQPDINGPLDELDLLHSTVPDMLIFLEANLDETDPAIRLSHEQVSTVPHNEAGLGWFVYQTPQGTAIGKGGNSVHMSCRFWALPAKKAGVVCFANNNQLDWGELVEDIMAILARD